MQTIYLDISNKGVYPCIHAKQSEVGRKFRAVITDGGVPYNIPNTALLSVWYSGNTDEGNYSSIGENSAFSVIGNKVDVEMVAQMLLKPGHGELCLSISNANGTETNTWNIPYEVEHKPGAGSSVPTEYYTALTEVSAQAAQNATAAESAAIRANSSRPFSLNNVVCVGDSFAAGWIPANGGTLITGWPEALEEMEKTQNPGATFRVVSNGSAGFTTDSGTVYDENGNVDDVKSNRTLVDALVQDTADMTDEERSSVETVLVVGGLNDILRGNVHVNPANMIETAKERFSNAKIVIAMNPLSCTVESEKIQEVTKISEDPRVCVLTDSCYWILGNPAWKSEDNIHPSQAGYRQIAARLFYASRGLVFDCNWQYSKIYGGNWGDLNLNILRSGNMVTFHATATIRSGYYNSVQLGAKPEWIKGTTTLTIPFENNASIALYGEHIYVNIPQHDEDITLNGVATALLSVL